MLPSALMDTAGFRQAVGFTEEQFTHHAMCGLLPKAAGIFNGAPMWAESDIRSFAHQLGIALTGGTAPLTAGVMHVVSNVPVSVEQDGGLLRVQVLDTERGVGADPAVEVGATTHGPAITDRSGTVRITRSPLPHATVTALRKMDLSSFNQYNVSQLPESISQEIPESLRVQRPVVNEAKRREKYNTAELAEYLDVNDTTLDRWRVALEMKVRKPNGVYSYSHAQATKLRKSQLFKTYRKRSNGTELRAAIHAWLLEYLGAPPEVKAEPEPAPHRAPVAEGGAAPSVEVIEPDVWLSELAAADHLGWPVEVLRIARKERTGPLSTYRHNGIMYRVKDLDIWKAANTTRFDEMKRQNDVEMDEAETAVYTGLTVSTLRNLRNSNREHRALKSPAFHRSTRGKPLYWRSDLDAWMRVNAEAIAARKALIANPKLQSAGQQARAALAARRAEGGGPVGGRGHKRTGPRGGNGKTQDHVGTAILAQTEARKPVTMALNRSLANGKASFADKLAAHQQQAGKVGKKTVVKRTLAGGSVRH